MVVRGEIAPVGDGSAHDAQGRDEGDPVGVAATGFGGVDHQYLDRVVAA